MLHTFWVTDSVFAVMQDYIRVRDSASLYIVHAMHDLDSLRYVLLVECSDRDATYLRLLEN